MRTVIVSEPQDEPVTVSALKDHLRVRGNDWDNIFEELIIEARRYVEKQTGRALITQQWELYLDYLSKEIMIPYPTLQQIDSIQYQDLDNVTQTLAASNYTVDNISIPATVVQSYGGSYPNTYPDINVVTVTFTAGFGDEPEDVPSEFKRAIKLYCEWKHHGEASAREELYIIIDQEKINWFAPED